MESRKCFASGDKGSFTDSGVLELNRWKQNEACTFLIPKGSKARTEPAVYKCRRVPAKQCKRIK